MTSNEERELTHPGGDWVKLRLTAAEADVLYWHLLETEQETEAPYTQVLGAILDKLPEHDIVTRPPSVETLIEAGYFDRDPDTFNAGVFEP